MTSRSRALPDERLLAIHEALGRFEKEDPTKAQLVKLRYFAGLTLQEAAKVLEVAEPTAKRIGPLPAPGCNARSSGWKPRTELAGPKDSGTSRLRDTG